MSEFVEHKEEILGSLFEFILPKQHENKLQDILIELKRINDTYSRFLEDNELSAINSTLNKWQEVSDEVWYFVTKAKEVEENTNGAFTLSTKEVLENLGYDREYSFQEKEQGSVGSVELDEEKQSIKISKPIEFGGLGKGYALDQIKDILSEVDSYYINAGGDVFAKGTSPERTSWKILLEHPLDQTKALGYVELDNQTLAVSAANRRSWGDNHHLINSNTSKPSEEMLSVYVLSKKSIDADSFATALFVSSFEDAISIVESNSEIEALLISKEKKMYTSKGFHCTLYN